MDNGAIPMSDLDDKIAFLYNDPALKHLGPVLHRLVDILVERGASRNACGVTVMDYIFKNGDIDGIFMPRMKLLRAEAVVSNSKDVPDELVRDSIEDCANYLLMWLCCRAEREATRKCTEV